jgi:hypothetical protein
MDTLLLQSLARYLCSNGRTWIAALEHLPRLIQTTTPSLACASSIAAHDQPSQHFCNKSPQPHNHKLQLHSLVSSTGDCGWLTSLQNRNCQHRTHIAASRWKFLSTKPNAAACYDSWPVFCTQLRYYATPRGTASEARVSPGLLKALPFSVSQENAEKTFYDYQQSNPFLAPPTSFEKVCTHRAKEVHLWQSSDCNCSKRPLGMID